MRIPISIILVNDGNQTLMGLANSTQSNYLHKKILRAYREPITPCKDKKYF